MKSPTRDSPLSLHSLLQKIFLLTGFALCSAHAQDTQPSHQQTDLIKAPEAVLKLGTDLFGDQINLYTGSVMQLVPRDIHDKTGHSGGAALAKAIGSIALTAVVGDTGAAVLKGDKPVNRYNLGISVQDFILNLIPFSMGVNDAGDGSGKSGTSEIPIPQEKKE